MRHVLLCAVLAPLMATGGCLDQASSQATPAESQADQRFPALTGRVVDQANLLKPEQEISLTAKSEALEAQTGRQFVIVTVNSLSGEDIAIYTRDLGRHWGIGRKDDNDGVILLVAPNERKVRIAVGYGLEKTLTDRFASQVIQQHILPRFQAGDMAGGILAGSDAVVKILA